MSVEWLVVAGLLALNAWQAWLAHVERDRMNRELAGEVRALRKDKGEL